MSKLCAIAFPEGCKLVNGMNLRVISSHPDIKNYSTVLKIKNGKYIVDNVPRGKVGDCYYKIICLAEDRKLHEINKKVTITDINKIIVDSNKSNEDDNNVRIEITGQSISNILKNKSEDIFCVYKFPIDNAYMVVYRSSINSILFLFGNKKKSKNTDNKNGKLKGYNSTSLYIDEGLDSIKNEKGEIN